MSLVDRVIRLHWLRIWPWAAVLPCMAGCAQPMKLDDIQSHDALIRVKAIRAASERGDKRAIPLLVDRLEDENQAVRFYAILALEHLTGLRLGYRYDAPPESQPQAIARWREFASQRGNGPPAQAARAASPGELQASLNGTGSK